MQQTINKYANVFSMNLNCTAVSQLVQHNKTSYDETLTLK